MTIERRRFLALSATAGLASFAVPFVSPSSTAKAGVAESAPEAALLLPLSGASADLGQSMTRAATLAQPEDRKTAEFLVLDTATGPDGAGAAAEQAIAAGAGLILGPVFSREVAAVVAAAGGRPVLSFSNDAEVRKAGAFTLGITASQGVSAILSYARSRGIRRVLVVTGDDDWSRQSLAAANSVAGVVGLEVFQTDAAAIGVSGDAMGAALAAAANGVSPDAVLVSGNDAATAALCARLTDLEIQILGPTSWGEGTGAALAAAEGGWFAAPDPAAFAGFAQAYEGRYSSAPGLLAALAFDAAGIARRLAAGGRNTRAGLLAPEGFAGVLGRVRFTADGACARELSIQVASQGGARTVAQAVGK